MMPRKLSGPQALSAARMYRNGASLATVAAAFKVCPQTIRAAVVRYGYTIRPRQKRQLDPAKRRDIAGFKGSGETIMAVARTCGVSHATVWRIWNPPRGCSL